MFGLTVDRRSADEAGERSTRSSASRSRTPSRRPRCVAKELWVTDVRLPDMLHGRVVHPKTLGSTLVSAGDDRQGAVPERAGRRQGQSRRRRRADGVGGHRRRAAGRGRHEVDRLEGAARPARSCTSGCASRPTGRRRRSRRARRTRATSRTALAAAAKSLSASYELPFMKHAPIGPTIAVGDVAADGTVFVHTHNQNPQALRGQIAMMLGTSVDNVVVRIYAGPGHYGRSNGGNAGAEDEAVHPVEGGRQAGARAVDARATTCSGPRSRRPRSPTFEIGLGRAAARSPRYQADHYMPAMQDDRLVGAVIAGLPTPPAPGVSKRPDRVDRRTRSRIRGSTAACRTSPSRDSARSRSARKRRRSGSACAITACGRRDSCSRTSRASSRSARRPRAGRRRRDRIPAEADRRRAADRRAQGGSRGVRVGDAAVAGASREGDGRRRPSRVRASR